LRILETGVGLREYNAIQEAKQFLVQTGTLKPNKKGIITDYSFVRFCIRYTLGEISQVTAEAIQNV